MNLDEVLRIIESHDFAVELNVSSDWGTFQRILREHSAVRRLDELLVLPANQNRVLHRVRELSQREADPRYENQWDVALSVYLSALERHGEVLGRMAASAGRRVSQSWWVPRVVDSVFSSAQAPHYGSVDAGDSAPAVREGLATILLGQDDVEDRLIRPDVLRFAPAAVILPNPSTQAPAHDELMASYPPADFSEWVKDSTDSGDKENVVD